MSSDPVKFLLVDDNDDNLVVLEALLRREGLHLLKARSGPEALELLLVHEVALALLDVQMPGMDGFELAELMRGTERTKHVPIIFVTAGAHDPQRVFKGYETGAVDFLFKPIEPHVLRGKSDTFFELYQQRKQLSNALRLNEMFVAILGHDLRNPLGALLAGAQLLEEQLTDESQLHTLKRMTSAGSRMARMIGQLLDLTRARLAGGGAFATTMDPVDVRGLIQTVTDELHAAYPDKRIVVEAAGDSTTMGDADRLLQVLSNVIANALQHGAEGAGVTIAVDGSAREVIVRVQNRGAVPPHVVATVFDPFRQRQHSKGHGLGLGLFIAQQIAIAHRGSVTMESCEATGTVVTISLPRA